ncbi:MAG: OsmC family protein [Candidatus Dormibacteraceae bacterium]
MRRTATATWSGSRVAFDVAGGTRHSVRLDDGEPFGDDTGMRPTEALLAALGGCTGVNAVLLLKKHKQRYRTLRVEVEGEQAETWPKPFTAIRITFVVGWAEGFEPDPALVRRALDESCERYCPVHATLSPGVPITHSYCAARDG